MCNVFVRNKTAQQNLKLTLKSEVSVRICTVGPFSENFENQAFERRFVCANVCAHHKVI